MPTPPSPTSASANAVSACTPYTVKDLLNGQVVTLSQIECMFDISTGPAFECADGIVGGSGNREGAWGAVADMAFNLGCESVLAFHGMISAIHAHDWSQAAAEMQNSVWCHQVGGLLYPFSSIASRDRPTQDAQVHTRCDRDAACMRNG